MLHICAGTVGLLSGGVTISFRKGSRWHALAGRVFVVAMLCMSGAGAYMALVKFQPGNILGGTLTFYLVATAWMTVRHRDGKPRILDWVALLVAVAVAAVEVTFAVQAATSPTGHRYGYPPGPYLIFGFIALLSAAGDIRMLVRRGIYGTQRIARHLWRMCFAWFVASASVFLARPHLFPVFMRKTGMLVFFTVLPLLLMVFWLVRIRVSKAFKKKPVASQAVIDRAGMQEQSSLG
jgi:hypothetical protein